MTIGRIGWDDGLEAGVVDGLGRARGLAANAVAGVGCYLAQEVS